MSLPNAPDEPKTFSKEEIEAHDLEVRIQKVAERQKNKKKRMDMMKLKMSAHGSFRRILIYLQYQWFDLMMLLVTVIIISGVAGIIGKIIWEGWKMIFSIQL